MMRVLLVEDYFLVADAATAVLEDLGHEVLRAIDGAEALTALAQDRVVDAVVLDFGLPDMNGDQLACMIKADPRWSDIPIVLATGHATDTWHDAPGPFAGVLNKPFQSEQMERLLNALCPGHVGACPRPRSAAYAGSQHAPARRDRLALNTVRVRPEGCTVSGS